MRRDARELVRLSPAPHLEVAAAADSTERRHHGRGVWSCASPSCCQRGLARLWRRRVEVAEAVDLLRGIARDKDQHLELRLTGLRRRRLGGDDARTRAHRALVTQLTQMLVEADARGVQPALGERATRARAPREMAT